MAASKSVNKPSAAKPRATGGGAKRTDAKKKTLKTSANDASVAAFFDQLDSATRADCVALDGLLRAGTNSPGVMYGKAIVGYGQTTLRYADGREAPWFRVGFSPRKQALTLYGLLEGADDLLPKLGKHSTGKGCLYIKRLGDIDEQTLRALIARAVGSGA